MFAVAVNSTDVAAGKRRLPTPSKHPVTVRNDARHFPSSPKTRTGDGDGDVDGDVSTSRRSISASSCSRTKSVESSQGGGSGGIPAPDIHDDAVDAEATVADVQSQLSALEQWQWQSPQQWEPPALRTPAGGTLARLFPAAQHGIGKSGDAAASCGSREGAGFRSGSIQCLCTRNPERIMSAEEMRSGNG